MRVRVAGGRRASRGMIRLGFSVKSVARYRGLAPVVVPVPPPKGGGCGSFAAYGGLGPLTCRRQTRDAFRAAVGGCKIRSPRLQAPPSGGGYVTYTTEVRVAGGRRASRGMIRLRSEEHTSELQSRQYLVCR